MYIMRKLKGGNNMYGYFSFDGYLFHTEVKRDEHERKAMESLYCAEL